MVHAYNMYVIFVCTMLCMCMYPIMYVYVPYYVCVCMHVRMYDICTFKIAISMCSPPSISTKPTEPVWQVHTMAGQQKE